MSIKGLKNEEILYKDFKSYKINDTLIGIGQIFTTDIDTIKNKAKSIIKYLDEVSIQENYKVITLFVTDIFENTSYCLYNTTSKNIIQNSFNLEEIYETVPLNNVVSRKIQIAPYIMDTIEKENY